MPDPLGRIPPLTLVSNGAHSFAAQLNTLDTVPPESLISTKARDDWTKWKARLDGAASDMANSSSTLTSLMDIQDTVGAVAYQSGGTVAAGVSRQQSMGQGVGPKSAGEHIARSMLAREIGNAFSSAITKDAGDVDAHDILHDVLLEKFWVPCKERGVVEPDVGVLLLMTEQTEDRTSGVYS
ncbi:hypothetical protein DXG01_005071 [Tephrocybe rancida]|nr:hypothetical protein DXG01_005071 [Tephrocybe rancida]